MITMSGAPSNLETVESGCENPDISTTGTSDNEAAVLKTTGTFLQRRCNVLEFNDLHVAMQHLVCQEECAPLKEAIL